jgi:hypothetical protein
MRAVVRLNFANFTVLRAEAPESCKLSEPIDSSHLAVPFSSRMLNLGSEAIHTTRLDPMAPRKRKLAVPQLPAQRHLDLAYAGRHFNLKAVFDRLNARHFRRALNGYSIRWGRARRRRPLRYFIFGSIDDSRKLINIHPLLDAPFVPHWFLEYIVYHEMLHAVTPEEPLPGGRRRLHTTEFLRRERRFPHYQRARRWERDNLLRFLR